MLFKYGPGAYLTKNILQDYLWSRTISQAQNLKKKKIKKIKIALS